MLKRRIQRQWNKHQLAFYDVMTVVLSFFDPIHDFRSLMLINKWFYEQLLYAIETMQVLQLIDSAHSFKVVNMEILQKVYSVKIEKSSSRFFDDQEDDLIEDMSHLRTSENIKQVETCLDQLYLPSNMIYMVSDIARRFPRFKVNNLIIYSSTTPKYNLSLEGLSKTEDICNRLIFVRCGNMVPGYYPFGYSQVDLLNCILINTTYQQQLNTDTSKMEMDDVHELFSTYNMWTLSPRFFQLEVKELKDYCHFEKNPTAKASNTLWHNLKKQKALYPYLQNIFDYLGCYFLESINMDLLSMGEKNFRILIEKWNEKIAVRKARLQYLLSTAIFRQRVVNSYMIIASKIDTLLDRKKQLALEKVKLESMTQFITNCIGPRILSNN